MSSEVMPTEEIRIVKSPLPEAPSDLPQAKSYGVMAVNITLADGTTITNPQQFEQDQIEEAESSSEDEESE